MSTEAQPSRPEREQLGFIGLGLMGQPMALNVMRAGLPLSVWNRSPQAREELERVGAQGVADTAELAGVQTLFIMLPDLPQIIAALEPLRRTWRQDGVPGNEEHGSGVRVVVMSSVSPAGLRALERELRDEFNGQVHVIDAPVSGGTAGAQAGTLSIMVGASEPDFAHVLPLLRQMGTTVVRMGEPGAGSVAKACNQLIVAMTTAALAEVSVVAEANGMDLEALFSVLGAGLAGSNVLEMMAPRFLANDYTVKGAAKFMVKDLNSMIEAAQLVQVAPELSEAAQRRYTTLVEQGLGDQDLSVVRKSIQVSNPAGGGAGEAASDSPGSSSAPTTAKPQQRKGVQ